MNAHRKSTRVIARILIGLLWIQNLWLVAPPAAAAAAHTTEASGQGGGGQGGGTVTVFGPKRYTRTTGAPNKFHEVISLPAGATSPFTLKLRNGEANGTKRLSSVIIKANGQTIVSTSDLNQNVYTLERTVSFIGDPPQLTLDIELRSNPGSYITLSISGKEDEDPHAPVIAIQQPPHQSVTSDRTPNFVVVFNDSHCGGVETHTFKATLDNVDRRSWFTVTGTGATATVPDSAALSDGPHTLSVEIKDRRNRVSRATSVFTVDTTKPTLTITSPVEGQFVSGETLQVRGGVTDATAVSVMVNGVAATITDTEFVATVPLGPGPNVPIVVKAVDQVGNEIEHTVTVRVNGTAPAVQITSPAPGAYVKGSMIRVTGTVDGGTIAVDINGEIATLNGSEFTAQVVAPDGPLTLIATARNGGGQTATAQVSVIVDSVPPVIIVSEPVSGLVTNAQTVRFAGTVTDPSAPTLRVAGGLTPLDGGAFATFVPFANEGYQTVPLVAVDAAGNESTLDVPLTIDRTPPTLQIVTPVEDTVLGDSPIAVQGLVADATKVTVVVNGVEASRAQDGWHASIEVGEGPQTITVVAVDAANNRTTLPREIFVDLTAPIVSIASPASGLVTSATNVTVLGTVTDLSIPTVSVNGLPASVQPATATNLYDFSAPTVPLTEGDNTVRATATDPFGRKGESVVLVTRDSIAPTVEIAAPAKISTRRAARARITAADNLRLDNVVVRLNDATIGTSAAAPFEIDVVVPENTAIGTTLTLTAEATDGVGNQAIATHPILVIGDGVLVGQALSDTTSLPILGATVTMGARAEQTDERGGYSFPAADITTRIEVSKEGMTTVVRSTPVQTGVGTPVIDARLTLLAAAQRVTAEGGALSATLPPRAGESGPATAVQVTIAAGTLANDMDLRLTPLSAQGLPGLLPSGWSPIAAFDLRADQSTSSLGASTLRVDRLPARTLHLVQYHHTADAWMMIAPNLVPQDAGSGNQALATSLPAAGAYALVAADELDPALPIPAPNQPLTGVAIAPVPDTATSSGTVSPALLPATGGTAFGTLAVTSPTPLVSGTVVQTEITETFTLANGQAASEETRLQDVVLFRTPAPDGAAAAALFPIAPSRSFGPAELIEGRVHLDVFAGRESARGTAGGTKAVTVEAGGVRFIVGADALTEDTAVRVQAAILSSFLPIGDGVEAVAEAVVDLAGKTLTTAGELSVATTAAANPGETWVAARVERVDGVPVMVVVSLADLVAGRIVTRATPGLPGVSRGGRYVFYRVAVPVGFVTGVVRSQAGPTAAVVQVSGLPFVAFAGTDGRYKLLAREGAGIVSARVTGTSLAGDAAVTIVAEQTSTNGDVRLAGTVTTATVSPADGAVRVPVTTQVEITTSAQIRATTATSANVRLLQGTEVVPARLVMSGSGLSLAIVPTTRLAPATSYQVDARGVLDVFGGAVVIPATTFTTVPVEAPDYDTTRIVFGFPDDNQRVTVRAPANSLPPGTQVLIVNQGNGVVLTLTADNDGALSGELIASISDRLLVTITDPQGGVTTFERSEFVAPDGRTAIGPGGGVVRGPDGIELRVPANAVAQGVELKITPFDATKFSNDPLPDVASTSVRFGGGIQIDAPGKPSFAKEVDLVFKKPADAPGGAFFYVYRRLEGPDGKMAYETLDQATVEGEGENAKVVTASYPFSGYTNSIGAYSLAGGVGISSVASSYAILMWAFEQALPAKPSPGVITGKVLRTKWQPGAPVPQYEPVAGALISGVDVSGEALVEIGTGASVAVSQQDGTFTMWDGRFTGGTVKLQAFVDGESREATAYEVDPAQMLPTLRAYPKAATVVITFPAVEPPPPSPRLSVRVYQNRDGVREATDGVVITGTPLVIGIADEQPKEGSNFVVQTFDINGETIGAVPDDSQGQPTSLAYILDRLYVPPQAGAYTIKATALPPIGPPVTVSTTFRAIADGGGVSDPLPTEAPIVIEGRTSPKRDAQGVPLSVFPQIVFSEPVTRIPDHVTLVEASGEVPVPFLLHGVGPSGPVSPVDNPAMAVTSLTLQPLVGLKFNTTYRLTLSSEIVDLDDGVADSKPNKPLAAYQITFTTFGPEAIGGSQETFTSAGLVVLGDRAYVATPNVGGLGSHRLRVFDVKDPVTPVEITSEHYVGLPKDLVGEEMSELTGGPVLATGTFLQSPPWGPSNVFLFDAAPENPRWIGAVSLGTEPLDGIVTKLVLRGRRAYAATNQKGFQIVDLDIARQVFSAQTNDVIGSPGYWQMQGRLNLPGQGFGQEAIVGVISVPHIDGTRNKFTDLAVGDYLVQGNAKRLLFATGRSPLAIADADTGQLVHNGAIPWPDHEPISGWTHRVAVGRAGERNVAIVLLWANGGTMLAVIDVDDPAQPRVWSTLMLPSNAFGGSGSMLFEKGLVYIGGETVTTIVNLADPAQPRIAGSLEGLGARLAFQGESLLLGARSIYSSTAPAGIQTAALGPVALIRAVTPFIVSVDEAGRSTAPIKVTYQVLNPPANAGAGRLKLLKDGDVLAEVPIESLQSGTFDVSFPENLAFEPPDDEIEIRVQRPDGTQTEPTTLRLENVRELEHVVNGVPVTPQFTSLSPSHVRAGATADVKVTVTGENLTTLRDVFVRKADGEWTSIKPESVRGTSIVMTLPQALVAGAGLLQIGPAARTAGSLPLMASDPSLPPAGTTSDITVDSVDTKEAVQGRLTITGSGFSDDVTVLLGRPGTMGVRLPTTVVDENTVTVEIEADALNGAGDLSVAVLSADQTAASASRPLVESPAGFGLMAMGTAASPEDLFVSQTHGAIVWNGRDQSLQLEGYGLLPGMDILFAKKGGGGVPMSYTATAAAATQRPARPITETTTVEVKVPDFLTNFPTYCVVFETSTSILAGPPQCIVPTMPARVPLGGRLKFSVYQETDKQDGPIHILAQRDPAQGAAVCHAPGPLRDDQNPNKRPKLAPSVWDLQRRLKKMNIRSATLTLDGNDSVENPALIKNPDLPTLKPIPVLLKPIPIVERETNRCDDEYPDSFYLRGVRRERPGERLTLAAALKVSDEKTLSANIDVDVAYPSMGSQAEHRNNGIHNQRFEPAIVKAAEAYGVPPQILKAQAKKEGTFRIQVHRYEPITIDFKDYSSETRGTFNPVPEKIVRRHLLATPGLGALLKTPSAVLTKLPPISGNGTATYTIPGSFEFRNRQGAPFDAKSQIEAAIKNGSASLTKTTLTVTSPYRPRLIRAYLKLHNQQSREELDIVEPPIWRYGGKKSGLDTGLPEHTGEIPAAPALTAKQFRIDYVKREITLGRTIGPNDQLELEFNKVELDPTTPTTPGACVASFDPTTIKGGSMTFVKNDTIASILERAINNNPGGGIVNGTSAERMIEFLARPTGEPWRPQSPNATVIDRRFAKALGQYVAAASFGPLQATLKDWDHARREEVIRTVLDLRPLENQPDDGKRCLQDLNEPDNLDMAMKLGAARHSWADSTYSVTCPYNVCDQQDWMARWQATMTSYNENDGQYKPGTDGISPILREAIERFFPRLSLF